MLYILAAMQKEADALLAKAEIRKEFTQFGKKLWEGEACGVPFTLIVTGVGKTNAAASAMLALARGADRLLNIGVAGGITPRAKIGSLWQIDRAVQYDFDLSAINGTPVGTLDEYQTPYFPLRTGGKFPTATLATADSFASGQDDMALLDSLGADVRDMEGAAIAHIAYAAGVPCTMFKSISDNAREESVREYRENMLIALGALSDNMREILEEANG